MCTFVNTLFPAMDDVNLKALFFLNSSDAHSLGLNSETLQEIRTAIVSKHSNRPYTLFQVRSVGRIFMRESKSE